MTVFAWRAKSRAQLEIVLERGLDEEQRRGDLERLRLGGRDRARLERGRHVGEAHEHQLDVAVGQLAGALGEHQRLLAEGLERGAVARGVLEPRVLLLPR